MTLYAIIAVINDGYLWRDEVIWLIKRNKNFMLKEIESIKK